MRRTFGYPQRLSLIITSPLISAASLNGVLIRIVYYTLLVAKLNAYEISMQTSKATKILLLFRFFHYIWFNDGENLCFILILKEKITRL